MERKSDLGSVIANGKTKTIYASKTVAYRGNAVNKDIVTWGDQYSMPMPGKGEWSTTVNHNLFEVFKRANLPVAYLERVDAQTFAMELCDMFPYEVVVCGIVDEKSSFYKRNRKYAPQTYFRKPVVQTHLKTSGRRYLGWALPCDDPLLHIGAYEVGVYVPSTPIEGQTPIFAVTIEDAPKVFPGYDWLDEMSLLAQKGFIAAREAYDRLGGRLYDGKWEFGTARRPNLKQKLLMADVFDADSMRLTVYGKRADKQPIRNGGEAAYDDQVAAYKLAVETSEKLLK
jgi:phosphoribosylaminoimidazole-succinocarboxamide synthase